MDLTIGVKQSGSFDDNIFNFKIDFILKKGIKEVTCEME
jgi:hypothetical protein